LILFRPNKGIVFIILALLQRAKVQLKKEDRVDEAPKTKVYPTFCDI